jgi:predicted nuclease of predicted toxin-antitoxin system
MERFLADENFNAAIVSGLRLRLPELDVTTVQSEGLAGATDLEVLAWAAEHDRILLTHDKKTIPPFVYQRLAQGEPVAGVVEVDAKVSIRNVIEDILLIAQCSFPGEHRSMILRIPL